MTDIKNHIKTWALLSRIPFISVGIAPMLIGTFWVSRYGIEINWYIAILAILAVILTIFATHYSGEYYDQKEDELSIKYGKSGFAGGTSVIQNGHIQPKKVLIGAYVASAIVGIIGLFIYFYFDTGIWTLPLGALGLFFGFFYSAPPFRFVKRKAGEVLIGFCYAFLPILISGYLQSGKFDYILLFVSIPIAFSISNVILMNEFPDYPADKEAGKTNLVASFGLKIGSYVYIASNLLFILSFYFIYINGIFNFWFVLPILLAIFLIILHLKKLYLEKKATELICGLTIVLNLSTNLIFILSFC